MSQVKASLKAIVETEIGQIKNDVRLDRNYPLGE
jgi:hypothetical protein